MDLYACRYKTKNHAEDSSKVLMTTPMIKVGGNNFKLFDDGDLTRETYHVPSIEKDSRLKFLYDRSIQQIILKP